MGVQNRIEKRDYDTYKKLLKVPADDKIVAQKYSIGATTCRTIRNTKDYQEYCERVFRYHGYPKRKVEGDRPKSPMAEKPPTRVANTLECMLGIIAILVSIVGLVSSSYALQPLWVVMLIISGGITLVLWRSGR